MILRPLIKRRVPKSYLLLGLIVLASLTACGIDTDDGSSSVVKIKVAGKSQLAGAKIERGTFFEKVKNSIDGLRPYQAVPGMPSIVYTISFEISGSDMDTITKDVTLSGQSEITETFEVPNGDSRLFSVQGKGSSGTLLYSGSTTQNLDGTAVSLTISMVMVNTTNVTITVPSIPSTVKTISFDISGSGMLAITRDVAVSGQSEITETFEVHNGDSRLFSVQGKDSSGTLLYSGSTTQNLDGTAVPLTIGMTIICTVSSSTWSTVDDFQYTSGQDSVAFGFGIDNSGNIYAAGYGNDTTADHWIVRKSTDGGTTWGTVDEYQKTIDQNSSANYFAADSTGKLYVAGYGHDGTAKWGTIRRSTDNGSTWSYTQEFQYSSTYNTEAYSIGVDSSDNVYWAGYGTDSSSKKHWLIRKSTDSAQTWSTLDEYQYATGQSAAAYSGMTDNSGNLYAVGNARDNSANWHWIVRKSTDAGKTWSTVDEFLYTGGDFSVARSMGKDNSGNLYVVGYGSDSVYVSHWIVRKSTDDGNTWSTVDEFQYTSGFDSAAYGFVEDIFGSLYVVGNGYDNGGTWHWIVRKSTDNGTTWSTDDDYQYPSVGNSFANDIGTNDSGSIYVTGYILDGTAYRWVIRELSCQ